MQAFARLSAVYGGTHMLAKPDVEVVYGEDGAAGEAHQGGGGWGACGSGLGLGPGAGAWGWGMGLGPGVPGAGVEDLLRRPICLPGDGQWQALPTPPGSLPLTRRPPSLLSLSLPCRRRRP